jgi:hypothetical protein
VGESRWEVDAAERGGMGCGWGDTAAWSRAELQTAGAAAGYADPRALLADHDASPQA